MLITIIILISFIFSLFYLIVISSNIIKFYKMIAKELYRELWDSTSFIKHRCCLKEYEEPPSEEYFKDGKVVEKMDKLRKMLEEQ